MTTTERTTPVPNTDSNASNPIEAVRARLDGGRKWCKFRWGGSEGPNCVNGAVAFVTDDREQWEIATALISEVVLEQYPERVPPCNTLADAMPAMHFNNHTLTTWPQMDAMLDKAARRWDEQVRP